ncbi:MAG: sugar ABC transporter permease [Candidatus Izemoplasmatales bacterium]|jgi:multiple sugar transport system permease protein|nr:sugar ABC transporter permease [bacterium]MDZ4195649.1 sugar ABC transporter permease [Candidatus Izemoplasmatales bacterium]
MVTKALNPSPSKRVSTWTLMKRNKIYYSMIAPFMLIFITFTVIPVLMSFVLSFTSFDMLQPPKFIGLSNYINLFLNDDVFLIALKNTLILAIITGPISYLMAFVFAWLINELPPKIRWLLVLIFYAPSISGSAYLLWLLIFSSDMYGILNATLMNLSIINTPILWLESPKYALTILIIVQLWLSLGVSFLAFIAGLQTVDRTLFEAGAIDGIKNRWQELWYITLPQMKSQLMFGAVMQITNALGIGMVSISLLGFPSVEYSGHTIVTHLLDFGSTNSTRLEMGYASAIATILFVLMLGANLLVQKLIRRVGT